MTTHDNKKPHEDPEALQSELTTTATHGGTRPTRSTLVMVVAMAICVVGSGVMAWFFVQQDADNLPRTGAPTNPDEADKWGPPLWPGWPPAPQTDNPRAAKLYLQAATKFRAGTLKKLDTLANAAQADPKMGATQLLRAMVLLNRGAVEQARSAFDVAKDSRVWMHPLRAALVEAYEPLFVSNPANRTETIKRMRALVKASPGYALPHLALAESLPFMGNPEAVPDVLNEVLKLDPGFTNARAKRVYWMAVVGRLEGALHAAEQCLSEAPDAVMCANTAMTIVGERGECAAMKKLARPHTLATRALNNGNIDAAIGHLRKSVAAGEPPARLAMALAEAGQTRAAGKIAADYLAKVADPRNKQVLNIASFDADPVPVLLRVLALSGGIDSVKWQSGVQAWLDANSGESPRAYTSRYQWAFGYARAVSGPAEATLAVAEFESQIKIPLFQGGSLVSGDIGRTFLDAGKLEAAQQWLTRAATDCFVAKHPLAGLHARYNLGRLRERQARTEDACAAYQSVLQRWPSPKPRSVTVDKARARVVALACGSPN